MVISFYPVVGCQGTSYFSSSTLHTVASALDPEPQYLCLIEQQNTPSHLVASREGNECNHSGSEWSSPRQ